MNKHGREIIARLREVDALLAKKGFPRLSPWWLDTFARFYTTGRRQLVIRAGRRAGKSSSLCRLAVVEALFGDHNVPPGDVGVLAFVSVSRDEAAGRLRTVRAILDALGVAHRPAGEGWGVELVDRPMMFRVTTASLAGVVGGTVVWGCGDELAIWADADTGANPATQVLAALRPAMATQKNAKLILSSSPFSTLDAHHAAFERGETEDQCVAHAATWEANPTITEEETRRLEPDEATWARHYAAIPMDAGGSLFFDSAAITAAVDHTRPVGLAPPPPRTVQGAGADFAFVRDSSALVITQRLDGLLHLSSLIELQPTKNAPLKPSAVCEAFAAELKRHGLRSVMADGHCRPAIAEHLAASRLLIDDAPEGNAGKALVYSTARAELHEGRVRLPATKRLTDQLREVVAKPTASGTISITSPRRPGAGHGDLVSAWVLSVYAALQSTAGAGIRAPRRMGGGRWGGMPGRGWG